MMKKVVAKKAQLVDSQIRISDSRWTILNSKRWGQPNYGRIIFQTYPYTYNLYWSYMIELVPSEHPNKVYKLIDRFEAQIKKAIQRRDMDALMQVFKTIGIIKCRIIE